MAEIRPACPADARGLQQFCWPLCPVEMLVGFLQRCQDASQKQRQVASVAVVDDQPIGFGMLTRLARFTEISDLIVAPAWRGQGIGTLLIEHLCAQATQLNVRRVEIGVAKRNPRAESLYRRLGFTYFKTINLDLGRGAEPVHYLAKWL